MLNDKIIPIDDQEIILGFINDEEHPALRDFDSLWDSVAKQEKISRGNTKATSSMTRKQKAAWLQKYAPETWQKLTGKQEEKADWGGKNRELGYIFHTNRNHIATWYGPVDVSTNLDEEQAFGCAEYAYTDLRHEAQQMPVLFQNIARDIENQLAFPNNYFNSLLVNLYTNKGLALHSDDEAVFTEDSGIVGAIAIISLGETTVATIARNDRSKYFKIKLTNRSCYVMPEGDFQNKYKHSVSAPLGRRISLTFRHVP
tara:strand:+ start:303 stop:1073 length:771 start_codon:yes stop_codon:yes gene_type:complete